MSATIVYEFNKPKMALFVRGSASTFKETLEKVFGPLPRRLTTDDLGKLRVISALNENEPGWEKLIDEMSEHGDIFISVEY